MAAFEGKQLKRALDRLGKDYVKEIIRQLEINNKKASGRLIKSIKYDVVRNDNNSWELQISSAGYLTNVDKGRRPNRKPPPVSAILPWVKQKGIKIMGKTDKTTAFIIARSIGKKGIKPTNILARAQLQIGDNRRQSLLTAAGQDLMELFKKTFIQ